MKIFKLSSSLLFFLLFFGLSVNGQTPRYRNILLRDFRTVWQGEVINYNIGTAAHCPGTLASLKKSLPSDVKITVWADTVLCDELEQMMKMGFPDVEIVYGSLSHPNPKLKAAVKASDLFIISSGVRYSVKSCCCPGKACQGTQNNRRCS